MPTLDGQDPASVRDAAARLAAGELVAFATETVYGLGANAEDAAAVSAIFAAKGRPSSHPLIVHVAGIDAAAHFAQSWSEEVQRLMDAFWPGPLTLIVPRRTGVAAAAAGGQATIGLRWPSHPVAQALLREAAARGVRGVAAPSANRFGRVSPTRAAHVADEFGPALMVLDGGPSAIGIESAIVDGSREHPALLRPGQLEAAHIETVLGRPLAAPDAQSPRASGTLLSHYAPGMPVHLGSGAEIEAAVRAHAGGAGRAGGRVGVYSRLAPRSGQGVLHRAMPADAAAVAHELFAVLREFDAARVCAIWVERPPAEPSWEGVHDRLRRAAA